MSTPISPASRPAAPLVFAHRGGRALGPENTLAAFDLGLAAGADGLELDVHLTRDGILVVHHDAELDRCTDARGPIARRTAAELATVDAGYHFAPDQRFPWRGRGVGIPTLEQVLARYPSIPIIIEIKSATDAAARAVVETIRRANAAARVCVGSFSASVLRSVRRLDPSIATSAGSSEVRWALYRSWCGLRPRGVLYRAFQVPEYAERTHVVTPRFVRLMHASDLVVQVWTVNDEADMRRLLDWGVDGLISDRPDVAVRVRNEWRETVQGVGLPPSGSADTTQATARPRPGPGEGGQPR